MYLVTAATEYEMKPFLAHCAPAGIPHLLTGIGPMETAVRLGAWLHRHGKNLAGVINFGVAGAYVQSGRQKGPGILDICVAEREVLGDLGVCLHDRIERFTAGELKVPDTFAAEPDLVKKMRKFFLDEKIPCFPGTFVTVNCASGTASRGNMLARQFGGLCENMEGAAVARVCSEFNLPWLEIRCISNVVEDRDTSRWQLQQACVRSAQVTAAFVGHLVAGLSSSS